MNDLAKGQNKTWAMMKKLLSLGVSGVLSIICLAISWAVYKIVLIENSLGELWLISPRLLVLMFYSYATALSCYIFYRIALDLFEGPPRSGEASPEGIEHEDIGI